MVLPPADFPWRRETPPLQQRGPACVLPPHGTLPTLSHSHRAGGCPQHPAPRGSSPSARCPPFPLPPSRVPAGGGWRSGAGRGGPASPGSERADKGAAGERPRPEPGEGQEAAGGWRRAGAARGLLARPPPARPGRSPAPTSPASTWCKQPPFHRVQVLHAEERQSWEFCGPYADGETEARKQKWFPKSQGLAEALRRLQLSGSHFRRL